MHGFHTESGVDAPPEREWTLPMAFEWHDIRSTRAFHPGLVLLVVILTASSAYSEESDGPSGPVADASRDDPARAAFDHGKTLYKEGKFREAASAFREANRLKPSWRLLYNLGQSEAAAKRMGLALEAFETYLGQGGDEIPATRQQQVRDEIQRLREMIGVIAVTAPDGATLEVDGVHRGVAPLPGPIPVTAGVVHELLVTYDGGEFPRRTVKVIGGQAIEVAFKARTASESQPEAPIRELSADQPPEFPQPTPPSETNHLWVSGWALTGVGAALLVGGAITGVLALAKDNDIDQGCVDGVCDETWRDTFDARDNLGVTTNVLLGLGATAAVTGVIMVVLGRPKEAGVSGGGRAPAVGPAMSGAGITWQF